MLRVIEQGDAMAEGDSGARKRPNKRRNKEEPITLAPLSFDEALRGLLATPPPPEKDRERTRRDVPSQDKKGDK